MADAAAAELDAATTASVPARPQRCCYICGHRSRGADIVLLWRRYMCRDRVECYQRTLTGHP